MRLYLPRVEARLRGITALWLMIEEAIGPESDDTEELSMKAPMSVSKPADLG